MPRALPERRLMVAARSDEARAELRRLLKGARRARYTVDEASTAERALDRVRATPPDCVILGLDLDDLPLAASVEDLAGPIDAPRLPVIALAGASSVDAVATAFRAGAADALSLDGLTAGALASAIEESIDRVRARRGLADAALAARSSPGPTWLVDRAGSIRFANRAAASAPGRPLDSPIGAPWVSMGPDGPVGPAGLEVEVATDGDGGWVVSARPDGARIDASSPSADELKRRNLALTDADRRKDQFLAMLAHELRNPLMPILNAMRIIGLKGDGDPAQEKVRRMVEQQVQHMTRLIDDLLDMSRIARGTIQLRKEPVRLADAFGRAVDAIQHPVELRNHRLEVAYPDDSAWLDADPVRLDQILSNLLANAAKYTDPGGLIELSAAAEGEPRRGGFARVVVKDNGIGIAADVLPRIFDLFVQADRSIDQSQGGLGIGLTLVRDLVELHGGTIEADSEGPGRGTRFVVRLPLAESPVGPPAPPAEPRPDAHRGGPLRVLLVDDNVHAAQSLELILQIWEHHVVTAHDGLAAVEAARGFRPEVVLLDIGLPSIDGYEVARRLRQAPDTRDALIVALTGYAGEEEKRKSAEAGFDLHLVKPIDLDSLEKRLNDRAESLKAGA